MTFLHPWAIWIGVAAAAGPLLIHWLTRPRPTRYPLSTLRFVREAIRQRRSWHRLRDALLLILRTLAVLLIALALARPQWGQRLQVSDLGGSDAVRVVLLDVSQSMAAREGAVEQIERARTIAARWLRYRPGLAANLILAGAGRRACSRCRRRTSTPCATSWRTAAPCRNGWMSIGPWTWPPACWPPLPRPIIAGGSWWWSAISIRSSWAKADFSPLPADTRIQLESTAPAQPLANVADPARPGPCGWLPGRHATGRRRGQLYAHRRARSPSRRPSAIRPGG